MRSTNKLILATGALTLVANVGAYAAKKQSSERPNIIFNLKDDEWEETNVIGNKKNTEILEKMRKECDIQLKMARGECNPKVYLITEELYGTEIK